MKVEKLCIGWNWSSPFAWTKVVDNFLTLETPSDSFWVRGKGWCGARRHNNLCEQAKDSSHILMIGCDQIHPVDMIPRLIERVENGCDVITALVPANQNPGDANYFQKLAFIKDGEGFKVPDLTEDLIEIDYIGSGVLMFPTSALSKIKKPWFKETFSDIETYERTGYVDSQFVYRLKSEAGLKVWVDTTINVKHLIPFEVDETFEERFNDWN